jgi:ABC-type multidrug transport system fused ATPase/permease subunit
MCAFDEFAVGKTVVVITHRLPNLRSSDRVIVLKAGKVLEAGDRDELLRGGGELATMWREQGLPMPAEPSH